MMPRDYLIPCIAIAYLALLFGIAYVGDKRADRQRSIIANPYIYTLSIAVYCTAWTYYGSVGRAASAGVGFLPIYIGPTLMAGLWWLVLRKIIRIAKTQRITSIADFIGSRYGKSAFLAGLVTVIAVIGIMPYISLQLKAVSTSYLVLIHYPDITIPHYREIRFWADNAFYVALVLATFAILFGTRHIDATERHEGMVAAIAFESLFKLIAFLAVGIFVTYGLFDGLQGLFREASQVPELAALMTMDAVPGGYGGWFSLTFLAMMAILFLPRQFQVTVVENVDEEHLRKAVWLLPLYLLVINLFVLPIAFGGRMTFPAGSVDPDTFMLTIPLASGQTTLAVLGFLGGLSAATGMVIVATIALATMVCNDLVMPALLRIEALGLHRREDLTSLLLGIRRGTIVAVVLLGYLYFRLIGESYTLVSIGLLSFSAAAQFAPAILLGIYWKGATRAGAVTGLSAGFLVWGYTLLLPSLAQSGWLPQSWLDHGPLGIALLRPYELFGLAGLDPITHSLFWTMLANVGSLAAVSMVTRQGAIERLQAALFVDVFRKGARPGEAHLWGGTTTVGELKALAARFLGEAGAARAFAELLPADDSDLGEQAADPRLVNFTERLLSGVIGAASARVMVGSVVKGEALSIEGVMEILDETSQVMQYSRRLDQKSVQLEAATAELRDANQRLQELDRMKDEFVSTVSHELRTPLTSIRAFSEILLRSPDIETDRRQEFVQIIVGETERLTRLINDLLDTAKIESQAVEWHTEPQDLCRVIEASVNSVRALYGEHRVDLEVVLPGQPVMVEIDRDRVLQVVLNLLSNAAKFCAPSEGKVVLTLIRQGGEVRVSVTDNGPGIEAVDQEAIFEKFHQAVHEAGKRPAGTGLGLAISRQIIAHHGGRIWVESEPGHGATFYFVLPALDDAP
jgi:Na+/proline symporter/nitrogen-specific signal transduction histidine kinase